MKNLSIEAMRQNGFYPTAVLLIAGLGLDKFNFEELVFEGEAGKDLELIIRRSLELTTSDEVIVTHIADEKGHVVREYCNDFSNDYIRDEDGDIVEVVGQMQYEYITTAVNTKRVSKVTHVKAAATLEVVYNDNGLAIELIETLDVDTPNPYRRVVSKITHEGNVVSFVNGETVGKVIFPL